MVIKKLESALDEVLKDYRDPKQITGPDGLLKQLTKSLLERAMAAELTHQIGYEKHRPGRGGPYGSVRGGAGQLASLPRPLFVLFSLPGPSTSSCRWKPGPPTRSWLSTGAETLTGLNVRTRLPPSVVAGLPASSLFSGFETQDSFTGNWAATRSCTAGPTSCNRSRICWADGLQTLCRCPRPSPWCLHSWWFP